MIKLNNKSLGKLTGIGFEKRYNRMTGELEKYVYKVSKSSSIKVDIKTEEIEINCGYISHNKNMEIILKLIEMYDKNLIKVNYEEECR